VRVRASGSPDDGRLFNSTTKFDEVRAADDEIRPESVVPGQIRDQAGRAGARIQPANHEPRQDWQQF